MPVAQGWRDDEFGQGLAEDFITPVTEDSLRCRVEFPNESFLVNGDDAVHGRFQNRPAARFALDERGLSLLALGHLQLPFGRMRGGDLVRDFRGDQQVADVPAGWIKAGRYDRAGWEAPAVLVYPGEVSGPFTVPQ